MPDPEQALEAPFVNNEVIFINIRRLPIWAFVPVVQTGCHHGRTVADNQHGANSKGHNQLSAAYWVVAHGYEIGAVYEEEISAWHSASTLRSDVGVGQDRMARAASTYSPAR